jgi:inner membrane protein involved in colicin E2 resistance
MNYFFISAAFFAFHLLLAYLVDHVEVNVAFAIAAAASIALVVSYVRVLAGMRRALVRVAVAQLIFLVLFSYAFFFEGTTGLTITVGAVVTLFVLMQMTAHVDWGEVFAARRMPAAPTR